jgi:hypothetical protein
MQYSCGNSSFTSLHFLLLWHFKQSPQSLERCDELPVKGSGLANAQGQHCYVPPHKYLTMPRERTFQGLQTCLQSLLWNINVYAKNLSRKSHYHKFVQQLESHGGGLEERWCERITDGL